MKAKLPEIIKVAGIEDISDWENIFRVFGVRRCQSMLFDAGLPSSVSSNPQGIINASSHFWQERWNGITWQGKRVGQGYSDPHFPENYRLGIQSLLIDTFSIISSSYSEADAIGIYIWSQRHFLDKKQADCLYIWSLLLSGLEGNKSELDNNSVTSLLSFLSPSSAQRIIEVANQYLGPEIKARREQSIAAAKKMPLSSFEQKIVRLEVTGPRDIPEVDVLEITERLSNSEYVYQFFRALGEWISASERESLLWWGYEQAAAMHIPLEEVVLPSIENK